MAFIGCVPNTPVKEESKVIPTFHFEPPSKAPVDSGSVAFALVNPQFPEEWKTYNYLSNYPFDKFSSNMARDFEAILSARGYRLRGPFRTYDELTFPDKEGSDLIMYPKIEIDVRPVGQPIAGKAFLTDQPWYGWKGQINVGGRISLNLNESLTNERMWTKTIELEPQSFPYELRGQDQPVSTPPLTDAKLNNKLANLLQSYYTLTMDKVWMYLDPKEMALVKQQAQTLKVKKRY